MANGLVSAQEEQQRAQILREVQNSQRRTERAKQAENGFARVGRTGAKAASGAAGAAQMGAKATKGAAQAGKALSKGVGTASKGVDAASKGISSAGQALSSTTLGSIVGAPLMAMGAVGQGAAKVGEAAGKAGEAASSTVEKGADAVNKGAGKVKEGAQRVRDASDKIDRAAGSPAYDKDSLAAQAGQGREALAPGAYKKIGAGDLMGQGEVDMKRQMLEARNRFMKNRIGARMNRPQIGDPLSQAGPSTFQSREAQAMQREIQEAVPESNRPRGTQEVDPSTVNELKAQLSNIKLKIANTKRKSAKAELERLKEQQIQRIRQAVKRRAKAAAKRGIIYVVDLIAAALDLGSGGVALLVDIFVYLFTFGWLNLELFYGRVFRKGKDPFISPLSWDPIPMPVDPKANLLAGAIIAADILIVMVSFVVFFYAFCMVTDFVAFYSDPGAFALSVVSNPGSVCAIGIFGIAL